MKCRMLNDDARAIVVDGILATAISNAHRWNTGTQGIAIVFLKKKKCIKH